MARNMYTIHSVTSGHCPYVMDTVLLHLNLASFMDAPDVYVCALTLLHKSRRFYGGGTDSLGHIASDFGRQMHGDKECPFCGVTNYNRHKACPFCGVTNYNRHKACPFCGVTNYNRHKACPCCGVTNYNRRKACPFCGATNYNRRKACPFCGVTNYGRVWRNAAGKRRPLNTGK